MAGSRGPVGDAPSCRRILTVVCRHVAHRIEPARLSLCACRPPAARFRAAAALPGLQRNRRDAGRVVRGVLAGLLLRGAALLRALRRALRRGPGPRRALRRLPRPAAALSPRPRRADLRRAEPSSAAAVQARRPHRHCPCLRPLDGARRQRASGRGRPGRAGAAPLAPAVHAPLQSGAAAGARRRARGRRRQPDLGWPPICFAGGDGPARRAGFAPRNGGAMSGRPSISIRAGWPRSPARPCCWSTTC